MCEIRGGLHASVLSNKRCFPLTKLFECHKSWFPSKNCLGEGLTVPNVHFQREIIAF